MTGKLPDWEIVLKVMNPVNKRPRRMSMHTLAACCGREDIQALIKEVRESKKVVGYKCPDVGGACIFYLIELRKHPGMIDSARGDGVWDDLDKFLKVKPYPQVKGFKRFAKNTWSGGEYGKGTMIAAEYGMPNPFDPEDYAYAQLIINALKENGYTPGITLPENLPVANCTSGCQHL